MGDKQIDPRKLCFMNLDPDEPDDKIEKLCESFGPLLNFNRPPSKKNLAFALFNSESIAQKAKNDLIKKGYVVNFARAKKPENDKSGERSEHFKMGRPTENGERVSVQERINNVQKQIDTTENTQHSIRPASSTNSLDRLFGICTYCKQDANLTCQRCGEFYCSEECQDVDWLRHKRICFPMPKLIPPKRRNNYGLAEKAASIESLHLGNRDNDITPIDAPDGGQRTSSIVNKGKISRFHGLNEKSVSHESLITYPDEENNNCSNLRSTQLAKTEKVVQQMPTLPPPSKPVQEDVRTESVKSLPKSVHSEPKKEPAPVPTNEDIDLTNDGAISDKSEKIIRKNMAAKQIDEIKIGTIEDGDEVEITNAPNHYTLFIRSTKTDEEFNATLIHVAEAARKAIVPPFKPDKDALVLAPFEGEYYRALVLKRDKISDMYHVAFIDFGNTAEIPYHSLRTFLPELKKYGRNAVRVYLKDVERDVDESEAKAMNNYLQSLEYTRVKVKCDDKNVVAKSIVELIDVKAEKTVNQCISELVKKRYYEPDIKRKAVNAENVYVRVLESRHYKEYIGTFILDSDFGEFGSQHSIIQNCGEAVKNAPAYAPKKLEMCLVQITDVDGPVWYRAQYQQPLIDSRAQVGLLDYGIEENVLENNIREFNKDLLFERISLVCSIKEDKLIPKMVMKSKLQMFEKIKAKRIKHVSKDGHKIDIDWSSGSSE